jgi:hypothetical protein
VLKDRKGFSASDHRRAQAIRVATPVPEVQLPSAETRRKALEKWGWLAGGITERKA